jgi:invasion protein IalB
VNLQSGTSIISGDKLLAPSNYTTCQAFGCIAIAALSQDVVDQILANEKNAVGIISIEGKQININMSNKGLKEGIEAIKK